MVADVLNRIAARQTELNRILTGWYFTAAQISAVAAYLTSHEPHPDVGGFGRFDSVPVFSLDDIPLHDDTMQIDESDGVRFSFVQMDVVN